MEPIEIYYNPSAILFFLSRYKYTMYDCIEGGEEIKNFSRQVIADYVARFEHEFNEQNFYVKFIEVKGDYGAPYIYFSYFGSDKDKELIIDKCWINMVLDAQTNPSADLNEMIERLDKLDRSSLPIE